MRVCSLRRTWLLGLVAWLATSSAQAGGIPAKTIKGLKAATVYIKVQMRDAVGPVPITGSGFLIHTDGQNGYIVTNDHVVSPRPGQARDGNPKLVFSSGTPAEKTVDAVVVANDAVHDLAVLKVTGMKNLPLPIPMDTSIEVVETMPVYSLGFPFGGRLAFGKGNPAINITRGTVSSLRNDAKGQIALVQIDAEINPGNSGGPIVDDKGSLVGVAVSKLVEARTVGFAVPLQPLAEMMQGKVARVHLEPVALEKDQATIRVEASLLDPLGRLKDIAILYGPARAFAELPKSDKDGHVPPLKGGTTVPLKVDTDKNVGNFRALGTFALKRSERDQMPLVVQASYTNSTGKRILSAPGTTVIYFPQVIFADKLVRSDPIDGARGMPSKRFTYKMQAGKHYVIEMRGDPRQIDPFLILRDSSGSVLAADDDSGGFPNSLIVYSPAKDGEYQISATVYNADKLGPFIVRIREDTGTVPGLKGFTKNGTLRSTDPLDPLLGTPAQTFNVILKKGKPCVIDLKSKAFDPYLRLENMAGANVKLEDVGTDGQSSLRFTPLQDGIYRAVATTYNYKTGAFELKITEEEAAQQYAIGPAGLKITSRLTKADPLDVELGRATQFRCKIFEVKLKAGQKYQFDLIAPQFDPVLRLEDPRGKEMAFDRNSGGAGHARLTFGAAADGVFRVIVSHFDARLGIFELAVRSLSPQTGAAATGGADAIIQRGMAKAKVGRLDEAIADLSQALELAPAAALAWNERGIVYFRKGQWDKANADFTKAVELNPNNPVFWNNRGDSLVKLGQHADAIGDLSKAIQLNPNFVPALFLRGSAQAALGEWQKASEDLTKASGLPQFLPAVWLDLALVRLQLKDAEGYRQACVRLREKWTVGTDFRQLGWILSVAPSAGVDLGPIIQTLEKKTQGMSGGYLGLRALGAALYRSGKVETAVKTLQQAADAYKQPSAAVWSLLALANHQLGHKDEAQKWLRKARDVMNGPSGPVTIGSLGAQDVAWTERVAAELLLREAMEALRK